MPESDPFYVGYLPLPRRDRGFLKVILPIMMCAAVGTGLAVGLGQRDPGTGKWEIDKEITLEGKVSVAPYAILHTRDGDFNRAVLLVEEGKFGAADRLRPLHGRMVRMKGTLIHRQGRMMLEISPGTSAVEEVPGETVDSFARVQRLGHRAVRGEVIDPKCYIGAMKPGGGKTHKACAELCLAGGIPPMLATWDSDEQREVFFLLMLADGSPAHDQASPFAGEQVELSGAVEQVDDLHILRVEAFKAEGRRGE